MALEEALDLPLRQIIPLIQHRIMSDSTYFGIKTWKSPGFLDLLGNSIRTQASVIVEIGNHHGGSTLPLAHTCDCLQRGRMIGLDLSHEHIGSLVSPHRRITLIEGDACASFSRVASLFAPEDHVLVIEGSSHVREHCALH